MNNKNRIVYLLQEIAIVVIGVLIAVSINNYKEKIDNNNYIEKTLSAIENEAKASQLALDTVLNRHLIIMDSLENMIHGNEQPLGELIGSLGGVQVASLKNVSLRFFISNKAELLEFGLISQLLEIEDLSNLLADKYSRITDFAYDQVNEPDEEAKMKFAYLLIDIIDVEETLIEAYAGFLNRHKDYLRQGESAK